MGQVRLRVCVFAYLLIVDPLSISWSIHLNRSEAESIDITSYHERLDLCVILRRSTPVAGSGSER